MPLTEERLGLFRGRDFSGRGWFVVDPARDPELLAAKWRENFASRNEPAVKRAARWAVGVVSYLVLLVLLGFVVAAVQKVPLLYYPGLVVAAAIGLAGLVGAAGLAFHVVPSPPVRRPRVSGVVAVDRRVTAWATDLTPIDEIWDVSLALDKFEQVLTAERSWTTWWDWEDGERPEEVIEDVIAPALSRQKSQEALQLVRVAERTGFELPTALKRELPPS